MPCKTGVFGRRPRERASSEGLSSPASAVGIRASGSERASPISRRILLDHREWRHILRSQPLVVYFDTNIYQKLASDAKAKEVLAGALDAGQLRLLTSIFNIEEPLYLAKGKSGKFWKIADCWKDLTASERIILPSSRLLDKEVETVLCNSELSIADKLLVTLTVAYCYDRLKEAFSDGHLQDVSVADVIQSTRNQRNHFQAQMNEARDRTLELKAQHPKWNPSLDEYCASVERSLARSLIERLGYRWELTDILVDQMLRARSLKLGVRVGLYLIHRHAAVGAKSSSGDARDIHHVIASSAAQVFVTNDKRLASGMRGVQLPDYAVMTLSDLLDVLKAPR